jgi:hypothetical protein
LNGSKNCGDDTIEVQFIITSEDRRKRFSF